MLDFLIDTFKKTGALHHCYIITGAVALNREALVQFCEADLNLSLRGNPDVMLFESATFTVALARELIERQSLMATVSGGRKLFLISSSFFTREAQNALLKVLEEPTAQTHFFILIPSLNGLLPTLLSRAAVIAGAQEVEQDQAKRFLASDVAKRLALTKEIIEAGDKQAAINLLNLVEQALYEKGTIKASAEALKSTSHFRAFLYDRGASAKMILEHLALVLPQVK